MAVSEFVLFDFFDWSLIFDSSRRLFDVFDSDKNIFNDNLIVFL